MTSINTRSTQVRSEGVEDSDIVTVFLPTDPRTGATIFRGDLTGSQPSIDLKVYDLSADEALVYEDTIDSTDTSDNPGSQPVWTESPTVNEGYNQPNGYVFQHWVRAGDFAQIGGHTYRLEYSAPHATLGTIFICHERKTLSKVKP